MAFLSGITGYTKLGSQTYEFAKWKCDMNVPGVKRNNFTSIFQILVAGVTSATITIDGPYDAGAMPLVAGVVYTFHLGWTTNLELVVTAQVTKLSPDNNIDDAPNVSITAESTGTFVAAIT